jgi:eukaryotic-like serine/threonine-protein kinase
MSEPACCGKCQYPLPVNAPLGLCPLCLLRSGVDADSLSLAHPGEAVATAHWNEGMPHQSVLDVLKTSLGEVAKVLLREAGDESQPGEPGERVPDSLSQAIGRYRLQSRIGGGGMGDVFRGRDTDLGREIAFKVLRDEHREHPDLARRFVEEAQIGGQLVHPGIVPIYELGSLADYRPFFTMKQVKGRTLHELLAARRTAAEDLPRYLSIFEQVCQTVAYAHARGVIHRDLKPANVMVGSFGEVQVMDWGLAKVLPRGDEANGEKAGSEPAASVIRTVRSTSEADASLAGSVLGTPIRST